MLIRIDVLCLLLLALTACKKQVKVRPILPIPVVQCAAPDALLGTWVSDSVHVTTNVDTIDSSIIERFPSLQYKMQLRCGNGDTLFLLSYVNFAGVATEEVRSTNFTANSTGIYAYGELEVSSDTSDASFVLRLTSLAEDRLKATKIASPNQGQSTRTEIFFRKE
ncbi:MAG: hypothetical protein HQ500_06960 [Flavobacteriales bacterium]|nr:hypothetical protein [Flavobacteriales bacterium]